MAMAGRYVHRLLLAAGSAPSSCLRALPALSTPAPAPSLHASPHRAPAPGASFLDSDSLARLHSGSNLRVSSFSIIDGGLRVIPSAPLHNNEPLHCISTRRLGLQMLTGLEIYNTNSRSSFFSTKASPPGDTTTSTVLEKPKTLEDFQHEEIVGPTVERDASPVADELRGALDILQKRMLSFQKSLVVLGGLQGAGAVWCYVSWHALDPTWQLLPSALLSFLLAFLLRQALQPISFFGKLEDRSRLRIITLFLMIAKGFASFFNRARIVVAASALGLLCVLLYNPSTYILGILGILK